MISNYIVTPRNKFSVGRNITYIYMTSKYHQFHTILHKIEKKYFHTFGLDTEAFSGDRGLSRLP